MKPEVIIVTAAYGSETVRHLGGQGELLPIVAAAGADGVEIRRELLGQQELSRLPTLCARIEQAELFCVYSAPEPLCLPDGSINPLLSPLLREAEQLNARLLKLSLGHYRSAGVLNALAPLLADTAVRLVIENDQTLDCGILAPLSAFFRDVQAVGLPVTMTFDMANWHWVGQPAAPAARQLASCVSYIHVKAARCDPRGWRAVALDDSDGSWKKVLSLLPDSVPRGIEFPLQGDDLVAVTRHYVKQLNGSLL